VFAVAIVDAIILATDAGEDPACTNDAPVQVSACAPEAANSDTANATSQACSLAKIYRCSTSTGGTSTSEPPQGNLEVRGNPVGCAPSFVDVLANQQVGGRTFTRTTQIPFIGAYAAATYGGFSVDALLRTEYYQNNLSARPSLISSVKTSMHTHLVQQLDGVPMEDAQFGLVH
jgi:hypothetical protein